MANLIVIARNDQPKREEQYPQTWLLFKGDNMIEVHVAHDSLNRPLVRDKGAA
jgi:hypothetical protein